jgi:phosphatidylglycerol lysyltransferase
LLRRGKYVAWLISIPIFVFLASRNLRHLISDLPDDVETGFPLPIINVILPISVLAGLIYYRTLFTVRSEVRNFTTALVRIAIVFLVAFSYGVIGFQLLDDHDFHHEFSLATGAHYTIDQFDLTTDKQLTPYTRRANNFLNSLIIVSLGSLFYAGVSLFAPIRFRVGNQRRGHKDMNELILKHSTTSEDFFKFWPRDKAYFFNPARTAGLAYKTVRGVALVAGDPVGPKAELRDLMSRFIEYCRVNDWEPALIHAESRNLQVYKRLNFEIQKIGYSCEILEPPHSKANLKQLRDASNDWLKIPARSERGFMMGYYSDAYMQQCKVMVVKNAEGKIEAFVNQLPSFHKKEANFDLLRHSQHSLGNINDFLMMNFIEGLGKQ